MGPKVGEYSGDNYLEKFFITIIPQRYFLKPDRVAGAVKRDDRWSGMI